MNYLCILNERNGIEINFIIDSKFDVIPILFCNKLKGNVMRLGNQHNLNPQPNQQPHKEKTKK